MDWQVLETCCQRETSESIDSDKKLTFTSFFTICSGFFLTKTNERKMEATEDRHNVQFPKCSSIKVAS